MKNAQVDDHNAATRGRPLGCVLRVCRGKIGRAILVVLLGIGLAIAIWCLAKWPRPEASTQEAADYATSGSESLDQRGAASGPDPGGVGRPAPSAGRDTDAPKVDKAAEVSPSPEVAAAGFRAEAAAVAERLVKAYPKSPEALAVAALMYDRFRSTKEATRYWSECLRLNPNLPDPYQNLGVIALRKGDYEKAVRLLRKGIECNRRLCAAYAPLAKALMSLGKPREAAAVLEDALKACSPDSEQAFFLGEAYLQLKEYEKAKKSYETTIRIDPTCANAYHGLTRACEQLGEKQRAETYLAVFQKLKEEDQKREKQRMKAYDDQASLRQGVASVYANAGIVYRKFGDAKQAEEHWLKSAAMDPTSSAPRGELAVMYQQQERFADALEMFEQLARLEPRRAVFPLNIGMMNARLNRFEAAEKAFRKAVELAPKRPEGYLALADFYLRTQQNAAEAKALATTAVQLIPTAAGYAILTAACEMTGDHAGARTAIEKAIQLEPQNQQYRAMQRAIQNGP